MDNFFRENNFFLISLGAIFGAIFRWQIGEVFIVNIIGCFILGFINASSISKRYKLIFGFGFCGSLTTFSGWSFQLYKLLSQGQYKLFLFNVISIVLMGVVSIGLGHMFAKKLNADKTLVQKSGYFARSAAPNSQDIDLIQRSSKLAADYALQGKSGVVGMDEDDQDQLTLIGFERIKGGKPFDFEQSWFNDLLTDIGQPK